MKVYMTYEGDMSIARTDKADIAFWRTQKGYRVQGEPDLFPSRKEAVRRVLILLIHENRK